MDRILVEGGVPLSGEIEISGAKNACLALMPAALIVVISRSDYGRQRFGNQKKIMQMQICLQFKDAMEEINWNHVFVFKQN